MTAGSLKGSHLEIEPHELVEFLLREAGQHKRDAVNPADVLDVLDLKCRIIDFEEAIGTAADRDWRKLRAVLSLPHRIIAVDKALSYERTRFSILHEVGHYVLPEHEGRSYVCDEACLTYRTRLTLEKQANDFAASLLFKGERFTLEANSHEVNPKTVKELAQKYQASFEATARRLVERNLRACMLVVFKKSGRSVIDDDLEPQWEVRYCAASARFKNEFFASLQGQLPPDLAASLMSTSRDIADSHPVEVEIPGGTGDVFQFKAELFSNQHNIMCFLSPIEE